jgi:hypothetical protein
MMLMKKLKQYDTQMLVNVAVCKLLMACYVVLVLMRSRWIVLIVRGLEDMLCLERREKISVKDDHRRGRGGETGIEGSDGQTEVIPAKAPAASRVGVSNVLFPLSVKSWREMEMS